MAAVTAHSMRGDRDRCHAEAMDDHLGKPLDGQGLDAEHPPRPSAPATDAEVVARVRGEIGGKLLASLAAILLEDGEASVARMRAALARGDAVELGELAHRLKGGASSLGASAMAETAREMEERTRAGELSGVAALIDRLADELEQTRAELARH